MSGTSRGGSGGRGGRGGRTGRTGRRPGPGSTKPAILDAARELFAELGYEGTSVRAVAARAGVDVAMISYHFGGKEALFTAAQELPADPRAVLSAAISGPLDAIGERIATAVVSVWSDPASQSVLTAAIRSNLSRGPGLQQIGGFIQEAVADTLAGALREREDVDFDDDECRERAYLAAAQLAGVLMTRYLLQLPQAVAFSDDEVVRLLAGALQQHLTGARDARP